MSVATTQQAQIVGSGGTPTLTLGSGAGTGSTYTIEGDNTSGVITITTGTGLTTNAMFFTLTLADGMSFPTNMITHLTSVGTNALDLINNVMISGSTPISSIFNLKGLGLTIGTATTYKLLYLNTGYKK